MKDRIKELANQGKLSGRGIQKSWFAVNIGMVIVVVFTILVLCFMCSCQVSVTAKTYHATRHAALVWRCDGYENR